MNKAVLFLVFNRLDTVQKVFPNIAEAKPPRLYIASDGARNTVEGEDEKVAEIRNWILDNINWECEVKTKFNDKNLGCGKGVASAITWFFESETDGIILEDDCVPNKSFFRFCEEMLDYYKDDKRVWHISGYNPLGCCNIKESYYFAKIQHCWGWATWADRWSKYKLNLTNCKANVIENFSNKVDVKKYWAKVLSDVKQFKIDTWDYQWVFIIVANKGLCINPSKNMISNIGFSGVHFDRDVDNPLLNSKLYETDRIVHPKKVEFNEKLTNRIYKETFGIKKSLRSYFFNKEKCGDKRKVTILGFIKFNYHKKNADCRPYEILFKQYKDKERFIEQRVILDNRELIIPDAVSFAYQIKEIFIENIYKFSAKTKRPLIYDCGSNIGISVLYYKKLYPDAIIKAFEADKKIYDILKHNTKDINNIELFNNAVWVNYDELCFNSEGADGGSLINHFDNIQKVKAVRLKDMLAHDEKVDFLKIDIEGAETEVLKDCKNELKNVENIFVEYHSLQDTNQTLDEILLILKNAGFRYHIENISNQKTPFVIQNIYCNMDLQVNIFGFRK